MTVRSGAGPATSDVTLDADRARFVGRHGRPATGRSLVRNWLLTGVIAGGLGVTGLAVAGSIGAAAGVSASLLGLVSAIIPLFIVVPLFLWLDRFEAEPTRYLVFAFLWGAIVAVAAALVFNTLGAYIIMGTGVSADDSTATTAVFIAPVVEEIAKGLLVLLIWRLAKNEFDGVVDGMVYAGVTAAGFAFTENIQYLSLAWVQFGSDGFTGTFISRCLLSPFAHPMFTICIGIGIGMAAVSRNRLIKILAPLVGLVMAILLHALWNFGAMSGAQGMIAMYVAIQVPLFCLFVGFVVWARYREGRIIGQFLSPYAAAGLFAQGEVTMLASTSARREARSWAKTNFGAPGLRAMRAFQDDASELALLRRRMHYDSANPQARQTERELVQSVMRLRHTFAGDLV